MIARFTITFWPSEVAVMRKVPDLGGVTVREYLHCASDRVAPRSSFFDVEEIHVTVT